MMDKNRIRVHFLDEMILIGLALGAVYWIIECLLYTFLTYEISFLDRLIGPDLSGLSTRIIVICLFLISVQILYSNIWWVSNNNVKRFVC